MTFFFDTMAQDIVNVSNEKRPTMGVKSVAIHIDNDHPHLITEEIENIGTMKRKLYTHFPPDIAPSDFSSLVL